MVASFSGGGNGLCAGVWRVARNGQPLHTWEGMQKRLLDELDAEKRPFIHLLDGDYPTTWPDLRSLVDTPITRYSMDTLLFIRMAVGTWQAELRIKPPKDDSAFAPMRTFTSST
jgi:hypothetical protein